MNHITLDYQTIFQLIKKELKKSKRIQVGLCWLIGRWLKEELEGMEEIEHTEKMDDYGVKLSTQFGCFFRAKQLMQMTYFFELFPIWENLCLHLTWSHYVSLIKIKEQKKRDYYLLEASKNHWTVRELQRQIQAQQFERMQKANGSIVFPKQWIKDHYILEFANKQDDQQSLREAELEKAILDEIRLFLLELGNGFAFVGQQKRMLTESGKSLVIDLVFYHYLLHCFVLVDLKIGALSYQDIGQMDTYVRVFDHYFRNERHMPTLGLILCSDKDQSLARYSILHQSSHIFASTYQLHLPSHSELNKRLEELYNLYFSHY